MTSRLIPFSFRLKFLIDVILVPLHSQAENDSEMSLAEGEIIEHTIQTSNEWWRGVGADGSKRGIFPGKLSPCRALSITASQSMLSHSQLCGDY
jgi:hypothetical protein